MTRRSLVQKLLLDLPRAARRAFLTWRWSRVVKSHGPRFRVNHRSAFTRNTTLGTNTNFNGMVIRGGGPVQIGDNFHSGSECLILTDNHDFDRDDFIPYGPRVLSKPVTIGNNVWLGNRVIILPGARIRDGAIIQAGAVVSGEIPYCAIAGGNPARVFKYRDVAHYEELLAAGRFH